jgi:arylsulfatase A-like enzyme
MGRTILCLVILAIASSCYAQPGTGAVTGERPNILIIVADDLGFSDLGCYGAEVIETPSLTALAKQGVRFTQFYSAGRGCPTRASLLTGLYAHQADMGHMLIDFGVPGYRGNLNDECATLAEMLGAAGYQTYMAGKWHLTRHVDKNAPKHTWPRQRGFDQFFGTLLGAGNHFEPATLTRGNEPAGHEENADFYYTEAIGQEAATMLDRAVKNPAPFFMYVSFTAPHWPLHTRPVLLDAYRGKFYMGWDELREKRHQRMIDMRIVNRYWRLSPRDPRVLSWHDAPFKDWHQRRMEAYAAQVESMDQAIGEILEKVKQLGRDQNTLVMFLSDNGAGSEEVLPEWSGLHIPEKTSKGVSVQVGNNPQVMPGDEGTYQSYGVPWANVSNTPFRSYKGTCYEGGIAVPLIVRWPAVIRPTSGTGDLTREIAHAIDVAATCYDAAGVPYPQVHEGHRIKPLEGTSLLPALLGKEMPLRPLFFEHEGNRAVRFGKWKLVAGAGGAWELYDMNADRTELKNLAEQNASVVEKMAALYEEWAARVGVQPWQTGE